MMKTKKQTSLILGLMCLATSLHGVATNKNPKRSCPELCSTFPMNAKNECCHNIHLDIGLLYQQPSIPNQIAGFINEELQDTTISGVNYVTDQSKMLMPCFDYAIGLTASLGYLTKHDDWYMGARFDWLNAKARESYNVTEESNKNISVWYPWVGSFNQQDEMQGQEFLDDNTYNKSDFNASLTFYNLDLVLSRGGYQSAHFSYEPFVGVKALWFSNKQNQSYYVEDGTESIQTYLITKNDNWGAGPMFGFNGEYYFVENFSIFSDSDIALLYGSSNWGQEANYTEYNSNTLEDVYTSNLYGNINCMIYVPIRSIIGLKFSQYCVDDTHYIALKIGYDVRSVLSFWNTDRGFYTSGLYTNLIWNF